MIALTEIMNNNPYAKCYKHLHQLSNIQNHIKYLIYQIIYYILFVRMIKTSL